jgi:hypothetical protein
MPTLTAPTGTDHPSPGIGLFTLGVLAGERGWLEGLDRRLVGRCGWLAMAGALALVVLAASALAADQPDAVAVSLWWGPGSAAAGAIRAHWFSVLVGAPMAPMCCIPRCWWCCRCLPAPCRWPRGQVPAGRHDRCGGGLRRRVGLTRLRVAGRLL